MSLSDRLAAAQRERGSQAVQTGQSDGDFTGANPRARRNADPYLVL